MTEATLTEAEETTTPTEAEPDDYVLEISTEAVPAQKFKIDEEVYQLFSFEHLSPKQEAKVTACFARFQRTYLALDRAKTETQAEKIAEKVREHRLRLIGLMTDVPYEVYEPLSPAKQGQILRAIQDEIGAEAEDELGVEDDGEEV